ncbi:M48 family metallopeptidase [Mariprofundus sp. KV]|uniref:M48 family metallopeptidase n=1 Tax=Mariprofundus sp. KV TaxID=2608715 RepID=UPI0015A4D514|nr:M48 family metallopeptidase [Mariprofundus sp. KV]NWF35365.1 M48 family metallopeptidase [Mariprofundus sp. KV]
MMAWTWMVFGFALLATVTGLYLALRQKRAVASNRGEVPTRFAEKVSLAAHQKAADYTAAKLRLGSISGVWGLLLLVIWTVGGGLAWLGEFSASFELSVVWSGVLFMLLFFLIGTLIDLPMELYGTFAIEARFGFNKMTLPLFFSDMAKQFLLMLAIGTPLAWVVLTLMQSAGSLWWLYAWLFWTAFMLLMMWGYPTLIAPLFNKFEPLPEGEMKATIEALLKRCGFESNGLFVMDGSKRSSHGNAYFTGLGNAKRIVFFDTLINQLEPIETEAVLAHELGHFHHGHVKKRLIVMVFTTLIGFALLGWLSQQPWFYAGLGITEPSNAAALLLFMLVIPAFTFLLTPLMSYFSRKDEFEADAYAVANSSGEALVSALVKMYEDNASTLTPDPLYSAWHDSHPPAPIRIDHIESLLPRS